MLTKRPLSICLLLCIIAIPQTNPSMCRRIYNRIFPRGYQELLVTHATRLASTLAVNAQQLHIFIPHIVSAGVSLEELMQHDGQHPIMARGMALVAATLPGLIAQGALTRQAANRPLVLINLATSIGVGLCSGILVREGAHLFFILFPNSWITGLSFIGLSIALGPTITTHTYNIVSNQARHLWQWCSRNNNNNQRRRPTINVNHPIEVLIDQPRAD